MKNGKMLLALVIALMSLTVAGIGYTFVAASSASAASSKAGLVEVRCQATDARVTDLKQDFLRLEGKVDEALKHLPRSP